MKSDTENDFDLMSRERCSVKCSWPILKSRLHRMSKSVAMSNYNIQCPTNIGTDMPKVLAVC
jgi:hypothetical protein